MTRPILAEISCSALAHNLDVARRARPGQKIWAAVKARGYGHSMQAVMQGLQHADGFAVLDLDEAITLRDAGMQHPILLLEGCFKSDDLLVAAKYQLTIVVHCYEQVQMIERVSLANPVSVYLKMNTGMNRLGFSPQDYVTFYHQLIAHKNVRDIVHMTHFANADTPQHAPLTMQQQIQIFESGVDDLPGQRSLANSAAILNHIAFHSDWIRPGIMLYGSSPFLYKNAGELDLQPVMTLCSEIIAVQNIKAGDYVGYGSIYRAADAMRIGVVACGYADGYPRHAPGDNLHSTPVLVAKQRTKLIGRVSMDMIAVDITNMHEVGIGTPVTLWGKGLSVDEVAHAAGTIGYELLCALATRVPVVVK